MDMAGLVWFGGGWTFHLYFLCTHTHLCYALLFRLTPTTHAFSCTHIFYTHTSHHPTPLSFPSLPLSPSHHCCFWFSHSLLVVHVPCCHGGWHDKLFLLPFACDFHFGMDRGVIPTVIYTCSGSPTGSVDVFGEPRHADLSSLSSHPISLFSQQLLMGRMPAHFLPTHACDPHWERERKPALPTTSTLALPHQPPSVFLSFHSLCHSLCLHTPFYLPACLHCHTLHAALPVLPAVYICWEMCFLCLLLTLYLLFSLPLPTFRLYFYFDRKDGHGLVVLCVCSVVHCHSPSLSSPLPYLPNNNNKNKTKCGRQGMAWLSMAGTEKEGPSPFSLLYLYLPCHPPLPPLYPTPTLLLPASIPFFTT